MSLSLYKIDETYKKALHLSIENEDDEELFKFLDDIEELKEKKVLNIACFIKNLHAESLAHREEADRQKEKQKALFSKAISLEKYLKRHIDPGDKFKDVRVSIGWRKSTSVNINCSIAEMDQRFVKIDYSAKKKEIGDALKAGEKVKGCELLENKNLVIK